MGCWWTGQDSSSVATLLPEHPGYHLRRRQQRPRPYRRGSGGVAAHVERGRAPGCYFASLRQQTGSARMFHPVLTVLFTKFANDGCRTPWTLLRLPTSSAFTAWDSAPGYVLILSCLTFVIYANRRCSTSNQLALHPETVCMRVSNGLPPRSVRLDTSKWEGALCHFPVTTHHVSLSSPI